MITAPLYLVACSAAKLDQPARAQDLYQGQAFRFARALVEARGAQWKILSAKYGLVDPQDVIAPYDVTLTQQPVATRKSWGAHVAAQLYGQGFAGRPLVFLAGASYVEPILRWQITQQCFANVSLPLAGLGIGYQLHYLKNALTEQVAA